MITPVILLASLVAIACANPVAQNLVVLERLDTAPTGFVNNGPAPGDQSLDLRIALASKDMAGLEKALYDVSTPSSQTYGQHLTKEEVKTFVAPTPETASAVTQWLSSNTLTSIPISPAGDWIEIRLSVSKANELLDAQFSTFIDQDTGEKTVRTLSYSIPVSLQNHIELVHPTVTFPKTIGLPRFTTPVPVKSMGNLTSAIPASCLNTITPACLQALYGIPKTKATQSSNGLGVSGFIDQFAQKADLQAFLRLNRPDLVNANFAVQTLDGGSNPQGPNQAGDEANLDIQYTVGVASGVPTTFISVGDTSHDHGLEGLLDIINFLLSEKNPPHVLTTSYGQNENTMSRRLAIKLCNAYMQLGARGTSILFASGDGGVAGSANFDCTTFIPTFPSGCPFLTSVGATTGIKPEIAANLSAGGFSNYFETPSYQSSAVSTYLSSLGKTYDGKFNRTGRGYPDLSAQGVNVEIISGGNVGIVDGTSCSSPIFASVIALLNDRLITAGKSPLGFLNPWLYSEGRVALNDITIGSNPGCDTSGFPARNGWDPVTGFGTPNFPALLKAVGL